VVTHDDVEQRRRQLLRGDAAQGGALLGERGAEGGERIGRHATMVAHAGGGSG
jgi:hypothetical protein